MIGHPAAMGWGARWGGFWGAGGGLFLAFAGADPPAAGPGPHGPSRVITCNTWGGGWGGWGGGGGGWGEQPQPKKTKLLLLPGSNLHRRENGAIDRT